MRGGDAAGGHRGAWVGLGLVFAVKAALALALADHPLLQPEGDLDAGEYWRLAQRVIGGDELLAGTPFYVSPLYIYWLALAQALTGASVAGVLLLQAAIGTMGVWLTARTARQWVDPDRRTLAGYAAGGALALTGIVALQEALILQSALDATLMAAFALATTRALQQPTPRAWAWCGVALSLLATNRPNAWVLGVVCVPAALGWGAGAVDVVPRARVGLSWLASLVCGAALVLTPLAARTYVATGQWQWLPGHGGLNVYIGNHAAATGTYTVVDGIRPSIAGQREDTRVLAERATGRPMSDAEVSSWFVGHALDWWRAHPIDAGRLLAYKTWLAVHPWELPVNVSYAWFRQQVWILTLLPLGAWLLIPVGLGVAIAGHAVVPASMRHAWQVYRWLLPAYLASVAAFFVVDRYRAPALVLCAIGIGVAASVRRVSAPGDWSWATRAAVVVAAMVLVGGLRSLPFQLGEADADTRLALAAITDGRDDEARTWLARAIAAHQAPGVVWLRAGLAWQARGQWADAERAMREAYRLDPDVGSVAFALGEVLLTQGKGAEAVPLFTQADRDGVRPDRVRLDLALAHWQAGDEATARATLDAGVPEAGLPLLRARALASVDARQHALAEWLLDEYRQYQPRDAEVVEKLGLMRARRGDLAAAVTAFEDAIRLDPARATARFNLAIARLQQGRRDEAVALLREALRIDPSYTQAAGALEELR